MRILALAACAGLVAAVLATHSGAEPRQAGGVIAYWSETPWPSIWTVRPDGTKLDRILRNRQNAKRPGVSPNGRWVVFDGAPPGKAPISDFDLQVVRRDGTGRRTLTHGPLWDTDAEWSPDGRTIAFTRTRRADWMRAWIWTVRTDGTGLRRLTRGQLARWSPDGRELVVATPTAASTGDLFIVSRDGKRRRLLLASPELDQATSWSPDGKQILFTRFNDEAGRDTDVYVINADGTGLRKLAHGLAASWSPDGTRIVYAEDYPGRFVVMRADGTAKRRIQGVFGADPDWR